MNDQEAVALHKNRLSKNLKVEVKTSINTAVGLLINQSYVSI
jgi:hypothetical protein